jgi:tetratricopeptide (TPR) repeat protein
MGKYDWYSRKTWTEKDQADYFARLSRSRTPHHKAQYLCVQGKELYYVGLPKEAITLFDKMLAECPEPFFMPLVCMFQAECLIALGDVKGALQSYRLGLEVERKKPHHRTQACYDFGKLVVENKMTKLYNEALKILDKMAETDCPLPVQAYKENGVRAIVAAHKKQFTKAKEYAEVALKAARKSDSGFRRHRKFGLVKDRESAFYDVIEAIAKSKTKSFSI